MCKFCENKEILINDVMEIAIEIQTKDGVHINTNLHEYDYNSDVKITKSIDLDLVTYIDSGNLILTDKDESKGVYFSTEINYCPFCSRKLRDELVEDRGEYLIAENFNKVWYFRKAKYIVVSKLCLVADTRGWLMLGDSDDLQCTDREAKIEIFYNPYTSEKY